MSEDDEWILTGGTEGIVEADDSPVIQMPAQSTTIPPRTTRRRGRPPGSKNKPSGDAKITVNVNPKPTPKPAPPATNADMQQVEKFAKTCAQFVAGALLAAGQADDAKDIANGAGQWAKAVSQLEPYEPWLVNLSKGGQASDRTMAWVGVAFATVGLVMPILLRHDAIPEKIKGIIAANMEMANVG